MNSALFQSGTEIAIDLRISSDQSTLVVVPVKTTGDLLTILKQDPPHSFAMLKTVCGLLGTFLNQPGDQILFDIIDAKRGSFRRFLTDRKYTENSIRSYISQVRILLKLARRFGWNPDDSASNEWKELFVVAAEKKLMDIARHLSRVTKTPGETTIEALDVWGKSRMEDGTTYATVVDKRNRFWHLLQQTGWITLIPAGLVKHDKYGMSLDQLPTGLRNEVEALLKWKQAEFAINRPKRGKIRPISAVSLREIICQLAGFVIDICGAQPNSFIDLVQKQYVERFVEWVINERGVKGRSFKSRIGMIAAVVKHHPSYASKDFSWFKTLTDSIPIEDESVREKRKASRYLEYEILETIPGQIRAVRKAAQRKKRIKHAARLATDELIMHWLSILPWRQLNIRECRIGGQRPNVFKGKIDPYSAVDKPVWVIEEEARNPDAEFWQIYFTPPETKTGVEVRAVLPRRLIEPLEEYLAEFRPVLLNGRTTVNLFLNKDGLPMSPGVIRESVGKWTFKCGGVRMNPHLARDSFAFRWLKEHPRDFLVLSKLLWHRNIQTTINTYGARFNVSSGMCAMESWLDQRDANSA